MLVSYLYEELDQQEKEKMEAYLKEHPEVRQEIEQMRSIRQLLGKLKDKEVSAPLLVQQTQAGARFFWQLPFLRYAASISLLLIALMLVGKLTGGSVSISGSELRISFWEEKSGQVLSGGAALNSNPQGEIAGFSPALYEKQLNEQWFSLQRQWENSLETKLNTHGQRLDQTVKKAAIDSENRISAHFERIKNQNALMMEEYWQGVAAVQKEYMDAMLNDFAVHLQQMREEDLQYLQSRLNGIERDKNQFQLEMEKILADLFINVGNIEHQ